ncbi:MAG: FKBP-type peptidyl-prolyl cis-trans isomerase, partial [Bacteroidales bacterium]|nr:FKBP-type peptidyl-prolyl cis-trans isomerase [Bacteroidales bacterium]
DGTVFDTSVQKTAIDNDIYNSSRTYEPMALVYSSTWSDIKIDNSTSYVDGFKAGLSLMWWSGQKATVIFASKHGYSSTSTSAIPAYSPLVFELELVPKE